MLKKINLSGEEKDLLEKLTDTKIYLKNTFGPNQDAVTGLLEQGKNNAFVYLQRNRLGQQLSIFEENNLFAAVVDLQKKLGLKDIPRHIECYDISHLSGKFVYGSMITFIDGRPAKKYYKLFKTAQKNDDFENHREVLRRRFQRCLDWEINHREDIDDSQKPKNPWKLADLIVVDGGKGQLSGDVEVFEEFRQKFLGEGLEFNVEICALAKREEEVFLPNQSESVIVTDKTRFLIQRIRDEAHRFAITNNRKARLKTAKKSKLDEIDGIGEKTKNKLLQTFESLDNLVYNLEKNQELVYELVGKKITEKLKKYFSI